MAELMNATMKEVMLELFGDEEINHNVFSSDRHHHLRRGLIMPPGFRFHPTDEELITYYLASKVFNGGGLCGVDIVEVDLNKCEPWELPDAAKMGEKEWYMFSLRDRKYPTGLRTNRATGAGYWKATGKDREVHAAASGALVGMKKTLVFYRGRAPRGEKTKWVLHEYRLEGDFSCRYACKEEWVICRIFNKSGGGGGLAPDHHRKIISNIDQHNLQASGCYHLDDDNDNNSYYYYASQAVLEDDHLQVTLQEEEEEEEEESPIQSLLRNNPFLIGRRRHHGHIIDGQPFNQVTNLKSQRSNYLQDHQDEANHFSNWLDVCPNYGIYEFALGGSTCQLAPDHSGPLVP